MAYSTPLTAVSNATFTAAQYNASDRDNMLETFPAKATAASQIAVSTGVNAIAVRTPTITNVTAGQAFTPTANVWADITAGTVGPTVGPITTGTKAIVMYGAELSNSTGGAANGCMSYAVSGATTQAATTANMVKNVSSIAGDVNRAFSADMPTLTAGSNTFTAKYTSTTGGAVLAANRTMIVFPL
jgi:hypothetical protein